MSTTESTRPLGLRIAPQPCAPSASASTFTVVSPCRKRVRSLPVTRSRPQLERSTAIMRVSLPRPAAPGDRSGPAGQTYFFFDGAAGFLAALAASILRLIRALSLPWLLRRFIFGVWRLSPRPMRVSFGRLVYHVPVRTGASELGARCEADVPAAAGVVAELQK